MLRVGDIVEVRTMEEVFATLDERGELDSLPFMPEMLQYCGKTFRIYKRADKTCDTVTSSGLRRLKNTVHLEGLRCDGQSHGGCEAGCLLFWKEAWLRRPGRKTSRVSGSSVPEQISQENLRQKAFKSLDPSNPNETVYSCQATELLRFTTALSKWDLRQYGRDWWSGNVPLSAMFRSLAVWIFNIVQELRKGTTYPMWFRSKVLLERDQWTVVKTPHETLGLRPGELVEVKARDEILRTVDRNAKNRGLSFDVEMVKYCGKQSRVLRRVEQIINEKTGKMMSMPKDCIVLDRVVCVGDLHGLCPRSIYPYWREIWLKRSNEPPSSGGSPKDS